MGTAAEGIFKLDRGWKELVEWVVGIESGGPKQSVVGLGSKSKERKEGPATCEMPTECPVK